MELLDPLLDPLPIEPLEEPLPVEDPLPELPDEPLLEPLLLPLPEPAPVVGSSLRQRSRAEPVIALQCSRVMSLLPAPVLLPMPPVLLPMPLAPDALLPLLVELPDEGEVVCAKAREATLQPMAAAMTADFSLNIILSFTCWCCGPGNARRPSPPNTQQD